MTGHERCRASSLRRPLVGICLIALLGAACTENTGRAFPRPTHAVTATAPSMVTAKGRPNVVVLLSDDQAVSLFDRRLMPNVYSQLIDRGANFTRGYVNVSQCCPSRASILTGLYAHNTGVDSNMISLDAQVPARPTIATALHAAGYRTMLAGKYLNSESCEPRPGWDEWVCGTKVTQVDPQLNVNGRTVQRHGYTTDIVGSFAIDFIERNRDPDHPFFLYYAPKTPHLPANDKRAVSLAVPPYRPPSYDALPNHLSRPAWTRIPPLSGHVRQQIQARHRSMTRQIPPLDDVIGRILKEIGDRAANTLVVFLSDNGFLYGEHRLSDKNAPYEESVRVPFVVRFPEVLPAERHFTSDALVSNVDVAPTIMEAAGIPWEADGHSLLPILDGRRDGVRDALLIEWCKARDKGPCPPGEFLLVGVTIPPFYGIETDRFVYVHYATEERELYDLRSDPYEMTNLANRTEFTNVVRDLESRLTELTKPPPTPGTTIADGPVGTISARAVTFRFFSQSRTSVFRCTLTGPGRVEQPQPCDRGVVTYGSLSTGAYVLTVRAIDESGVPDPTPATRRFLVAT